MICRCLLTIMMCLLLEWDTVLAAADPQITLDRTVHFAGADAKDAVVSPGPYTVERGGPGEIRLVPEDSNRYLAVEATAISHGERLDAPMAFTAQLTDATDEIHVLLLLPGDKGLDAVGSTTGVRPRAALGSARPFTLNQATGQVVFGDGRQGQRLPTGSPASTPYGQGSGAVGNAAPAVTQSPRNRSDS